MPPGVQAVFACWRRGERVRIFVYEDLKRNGRRLNSARGYSIHMIPITGKIHSLQFPV